MQENEMIRHALTLCLILLLTHCAIAADPAPRGAVDTARQYTRLFEESRANEAFERLWDFSRFQQILFQKDLDGCTAEERKIMTDRFRYLVPKLATPGESLKGISHTRFEEKRMSETVVAVRYLVRFSDGTGKPNTLILQRGSDDHWLIVNHGAASGNKLIAARLRDDYLKSGLKPAEFTNELIKQLDEKK
jgi:hypothetical protein